MDIFKEKRYLWITIIILLIMNTAALTLLWLGRPEAKDLHSRLKNPAEEHKRLKLLLNKELGFDKKQVAQYLRMRRDHQDQMRLLRREIREIKRQMFDEVLGDDPQTELSDSLLALAQEKQVQIEKQTFIHFLDLKKLCKPDQQDNLKILMHEIFRPGPPRGAGADGPPPRRDDRQLPPPPPEYN